MTDYLKHVIKGGVYYLIGSAIAIILAYGMRLLLIHNLSVDEYGLFYAVFNVILILIFVRDLGLTTTLEKFIPQFYVKKLYNRITNSILSVILTQFIIAIILIGLLWFFRNTLAQYYFKNIAAIPLISIVSFYLLTSIPIKLIPSLFKGFQSTKLLAITDPIKNLIIFLLIFLFLKMGLGIFAPAYAFTFTGIIFLIIFFPSLRRILPKKTKFTKFYITPLLLFSVPLIAASMSDRFISYFDTLLLTYFTNLAQVGIYNIILPSTLLFTLLATVPSVLLLPLISEWWTRKNYAHITLGVHLLYKYVILFGTPFLLSIFAFSKLAILILFGVDYLPGNASFRILIIGVLFYLIYHINSQILIGIGRPGIVTMTTFVSAITNILLNLAFIPSYGITGAALATTISYTTMTLISLYYVRKHISITFPYLDWIASFVLGAFFVFIIFIIKGLLESNVWIEVFISLGFATIVYFGVLYLLRFINLQEILLFLKKAKD